MAAFTVRVPDEVIAKFDHLAGKAERSRSYVAAQAIEDYVAREEWQLAEVEAGLSEANQGSLRARRNWLTSLQNTSSLGSGVEAHPVDAACPAATRPDRCLYREG